MDLVDNLFYDDGQVTVKEIEQTSIGLGLRI